MKLIPDKEYALPSIIKDPFKKENIKNIYIHGRVPFFKDEFLWDATVSFKNGNTEGSQSTKEYKDFDDLINELKTIIKQVS